MHDYRGRDPPASFCRSHHCRSLNITATYHDQWPSEPLFIASPPYQGDSFGRGTKGTGDTARLARLGPPP
jgi:hypothetical protein